MQDGAGWVWWMWLQTHSCITKNLYFLNGVRLGDTANHFQNSISQQLPMATLGFQSSHPHFSTIQSSQTPTSSYLTSTLSFTSSSPSSWQTIFVILHFFFFYFSKSPIVQSVLQDTIQVLLESVSPRLQSYHAQRNASLFQPRFHSWNTWLAL